MTFKPQQLDTVATTSTTAVGQGQYDAENQDYKVTDMLSSAWKQGTLYDEIGQRYEQSMQDFEKDEQWSIDDDMKSEIIKGYSTYEGDYLTKAESQREFDWRRQQVEMDRADSREAAKYGVTGAVATLAASVADPAGWVIGLATGGAAKYAQVGRAASGLIGMGLGGAVGLGYGKFEQSQNTSVTDKDVLLGAAMGAVLEGGIAALTAGPKRAAAIHESNAAIETTIKGPSEPNAKFFNDNPDVDSVKVNRAVEKRTEELQAKVDTDIELDYVKSRQISDDVVQAKAIDNVIGTVKAPTAQLKNAAKSFVNKVEQSAKRFEDKVAKAEARVSAAKTKKQVTDAAAALRKVNAERIKSLHALESKFATKYGFKPKASEVLDKVQVERAKSDAAKANLSRAEENQAAREVLDEWNAKPIEEKFKELFPDNRPIKDSAGAMRSSKAREEDIYNIGDEGGLSSAITEALPTDLNKSFTGPKLAFNFIKNNKALSQLFISPYTYLSSSTSQVIRNLGYLLLESGQGAAKGGTVSKQSASSIMYNIGRAMRTAGGGAYTRNKSYEAFAKAKGQNVLTAHFDLAGRKEFDQQIQLAIDSSTYKASLPDHMKEAVESVEAQMSKALEELQRAGVRGFDKVKDSKHYLPKLLNTANIKNAAIEHGQSAVVSVISKGYQTGGLKLTKASADKLAIVRYNQMMRLHPEHNGVPRDLNTNDLINELRAQKVDEDVIDAIVTRRAEDEMASDISDRAKKSLLPDLHAEVNGLKFGDLVDNDLENLIEGYIRESTGSVALKRSIGASTYNEAKSLIDVEIAMAKGSGKMTPNELKALEMEESMLRDVVDVLYGKDLNGTGWRSTIKGLSRLRSITGILRLGMSGFASIPELGRVISANGLYISAKNMRSFSRDGIADLKKADLKELDEIMPFQGEDWAFEPRTKRMDDFAEMGDTQSKFWGLADAGIAGAQRVSTILSGQRLVQGMGEKLASRSIAYRVKHGKITNQQARDAGWIQTKKVRKGDTEETVEVNFLDEIKGFMEANPRTTIDGKKMFNAEAMSPEMLDQLRTGMNRLSMRDMQRMTVGELPLGFNNWIGATLMQFKSFLISSIGKQLIHDVRAGDNVRSAFGFASAIGLASAVVGIKAALQHAGDPSERGSLKKYVGDRMTGTGGVYNALMGTGQLSGLSIVADGLATFNMLPEELMASQKNQWQGVRRGLEPPVMGLGKDLMGLSDLDPKAAHNLTPFMKTIGVNQVLTNMYKED